MALPKLFQRIFFHNNTTPSINEDNFNAMSKGLSDVDDRVIGLAGTIMEDVPQIQEDIEELEADMALIDTKIASATAEANRATTAANNAAASVISAGDKALVSEGWAKGTQNGSPVSQSSPYWENNAEYWAGKARSFTPEGYQDLVDDVDSLKETLTNFEESITGEVVDSEPYVLRQGLGNLADMALVGGSVVWNQLVGNGNFADTSGWSVGSNTTFTVSNNIGKVVPIDSSNSYQRFIRQTKAIPVNHKVLVMLELSGNNECTIEFYSSSWQNAAILTFNITNNKATYSQIASLTKDSATLGLYFSDSTEVNISNFMLFDLTQMFGSEIADYIYALEQATAGAGVAWFRQYFPNAYYGYQSGKIESVNPSKRVVEPASKNIFDVNAYPFTNNYFIHGLNGIPAATTGFKCTFSYVPCFFLQGKTLTLNKRPRGNDPGIYFYDANKENIRGIRNNNATEYTPWTFTVPNNAVYMRFTVPINATDIQIEVGSESTAYVPYKKLEFPFDPSIQLRGVPKLVDNKLSYDGDIYTADGSITRKYGIVDLGSLTYSKDSNNAFYATLSSAVTGVAETTMNGICSNGYQAVQTKGSIAQILAQGDNIFAMQSGSKLLFIKDTSKASMTTSEFKTAMSGVYLVYELAAPTTESAEPFQNPQRAFIDGTEEFVDAGVIASTRDVSIPVGNNTTYQLNKTLPPIEDYVDGALKFKVAISALGTDESGRTTASRAYTAGEFFYKDGRMYKVLTSIAQGATFTINTNCQQTTLFAELKALAQ